MLQQPTSCWLKWQWMFCFWPVLYEWGELHVPPSFSLSEALGLLKTHSNMAVWEWVWERPGPHTEHVGPSLEHRPNLSRFLCAHNRRERQTHLQVSYYTREKCQCDLSFHNGLCNRMYPCNYMGWLEEHIKHSHMRWNILHTFPGPHYVTFPPDLSPLAARAETRAGGAGSFLHSSGVLLFWFYGCWRFIWCVSN